MKRQLFLQSSLRFFLPSILTGLMLLMANNACGAREVAAEPPAARCEGEHPGVVELPPAGCGDCQGARPDRPGSPAEHENHDPAGCHPGAPGDGDGEGCGGSGCPCACHAAAIAPTPAGNVPPTLIGDLILPPPQQIPWLSTLPLERPPRC